MPRFRFRQLATLLLLTVALTSFACRRQPPPPPVVGPPAPPPPTPPPPPAPTITLTANPATLTAGQAATLTWQSTNATTVTIEPEVGNVPTNGNRQVNPKASVTYQATAIGPGGKASSAPARITVNTPPPPPASTTVAPPPPPPAAPSLAALFDKALGSQPILFDYDSSSIRGDQVSKLQSHAAFLKQNPTVRITIEGHADERGSQEYNIGLGDERASSVMNYLIGQGVAADRMTTISYGEERPVCKTADEGCYQQNRRAAFTMAR